VGVGSALGEPIPVPPSGTPVAGGASQAYLRDRDGQTVLTRLNEPVLRKLAEDAGGTYVASPQGGLGLEEVKAGIAATQKAELENRLAVSYDERYPWALGPSVACLLVARAIRLRRREDPRAAAAAGAVRVAS
jgi:Ca-activated chloride channel family protein